MKKKLMFSSFLMMLFFAIGVSAQTRDQATQNQALEDQPVYYSVLDENGERITGQTNQYVIRQGNSPIPDTNDSADFSALSASELDNVKSVLLDSNTAFDGDLANLLDQLLSSGLLNATEQTAGQAILDDYLGQ